MLLMAMMKLIIIATTKRCRIDIINRDCFGFNLEYRACGISCITFITLTLTLENELKRLCDGVSLETNSKGYVMG